MGIGGAVEQRAIDVGVEVAVIRRPSAKERRILADAIVLGRLTIRRTIIEIGRCYYSGGCPVIRLVAVHAHDVGSQVVRVEPLAALDVVVLVGGRAGGLRSGGTGTRCGDICGCCGGPDRWCVRVKYCLRGDNIVAPQGCGSGRSGRWNRDGAGGSEHPSGSAGDHLYSWSCLDASACCADDRRRTLKQPGESGRKSIRSCG